jgi:hypothetical protein
MRRSSPSPRRLDSITEAPEYECDSTPHTCADSPCPKPDSTVESDSTSLCRPYNSRSGELTGKRTGRRLMENLVDRYCEICSKVAVIPCKTMCCLKLLCLEHISTLYGPLSDRCPCCHVPSSSPLPPLPPTVEDHVVNSPKSNSDRPVILLVMQDAKSLTPSAGISPGPVSTLSRTNAGAREPAFMRNLMPSDSCGPCFHSSSLVVVLFGRMIGRMLSIVGLTLFLFVLLT